MTIASHVGQYRIVRKIGAGGMGVVFLGEHMLLGRRAAIKTLLPTVSSNREIAERFFNEARAASAISDPGVIQIFDFGYHVDGTAYIVMELLEGEALSSRIARLGRLLLADALRIARQITGSLAVAHAYGIVHRDLKPDNIFLVGDAEARGGERTKILDFGICKVGTADPTLTQSGSMIGTPVYMSPEQCRGGDVDHRADIYAFGCLLFHMLTGRPPFAGSATGELIVAHLEEAPPAPSIYVPEIPLAADALLLRCLAKSPDDRYQSMGELQAVLGELYAELDVVEPMVAVVPPAMPLGKGFRSVYDGNFAALDACATHDAPMPASPWVRPPRTRSQDARDIRSPPRARGRLGLVSALVAVAVIWIVAASHLIDRGRAGRGGAEISRRAAAPIEIAPAGPAPAVTDPAANIAIATPGATRSGTATIVRARCSVPAGGAAIDQPERRREAPRAVKQSAAKPRSAAPARPTSTLPIEDLYDAR